MPGAAAENAGRGHEIETEKGTVKREAEVTGHEAENENTEKGVGTVTGNGITSQTATEVTAIGRGRENTVVVDVIRRSSYQVKYMNLV